MTVQKMFEELIHYADYDYLTDLSDAELAALYNELIGEEK